MNKRKKSKFAVAVLSCFILAVPAVQAEPNGPFSTGFSFGIPIGMGETSDVLRNGFGFGFDFTWRPEESPVGLRMDMIYDNFSLSSDVLNQIAFADSGYATVWGFDLSAVLTPRKPEKVRPYLQVGPGIYYEYAQASRFSGSGGYVCDPWFGCYTVSNNQTLIDWSTWRMGWVGGAGINFEFDSGGAFFLQTQYHLINNANAKTEFMPIALGYRWSF